MGAVLTLFVGLPIFCAPTDKTSMVLRWPVLWTRMTDKLVCKALIRIYFYRTVRVCSEAEGDDFKNLS